MTTDRRTFTIVCAGLAGAKAARTPREEGFGGLSCWSGRSASPSSRGSAVLQAVRSRGGVVKILPRLRAAGVSIWLDTLSRDLLETGAFAAPVDEFVVTGATSNPTIFARRSPAQIATTTSYAG
jgi:hypothetical protein